MERVAIVGVGLIGGSFALALKKAGFRGSILGVCSPQTGHKALDLGVVDEVLPLERACAQADLVLLSHTIGRILDSIPAVARSIAPEALVTDAGSTKAAICALAAQHFAPGQFLGGHPMAGKETRGVETSDPDLFRDRTYVLTPADPADRDRPSHIAFQQWLQKIGARLVFLSPEIHDRTVAWTSHLPQLASTALATTIAHHTGEAELQVAGSGLRDMTRLALSSHDVWADIVGTNRESIETVLQSYIDNLASLLSMVRGHGSLDVLFAQAASLATRVRTEQCRQEYPLNPPPVPPPSH